jgi:hypothetical protein
MCPSCGKGYQVPADCRGRSLACKGCGESFVLEPSSPAEEESQQAPATPITEEDAGLVLGKLALKYRFLESAQLKDAILQQRREVGEGKKSLLGSVLMRKGFITQKQLDFLLSVQMMMEARKLDRQFGALAIKNGFASAGDVEEALQEQERLFKESRTVLLIGEMLVTRGLMEPAQRDSILVRQQRLAPSAVEPGLEAEETGPAPCGSGDLSDPFGEIFEVTVSEDGLTASITPCRPIPESFTVDGLLAFLEKCEINHGLIEADEIEAFLRQGALSGEPFTVARGTPPQPGRDAKIRYHFDTDPLKVGTIKEGGSIDFKDKGEIPQVKGGDLLAERIPPEEGTPGTAVTGRPIAPPKPRNRKLRKGKGTVLSVDGLLLTAEAGGRPEISADGKVFVFSEHKISGDVDLKTGHVEFEGDVHVSGTIKKGFHVKGGSLTANEIVGSEIDIRGDVVVTGGIIEATIRVGGNLRARYIHKTRIQAFGDVVLEKEGIDSDVETSGAFILKSGTLLSSNVTAKKGIEAVQVGSGTSNPCTLIVGTDDRVRNEIRGIQERIEEIQEVQNGFKEKNDALDKEKQAIALKLGEIAQLQDQSMVKKRQIEGKLEEIRAGGDEALLAKVQGLLEEMDREIREREETLEGHFAKEDGIDKVFEEYTRQIDDMEAQIEALNDEIEHFAEWAKAEEPVPVVTVRGKIFPYTTIKGRNTALTLPEGHKGIQIKEVHIPEPEDGKEWKLRLSQLKA